VALCGAVIERALSALGNTHDHSHAHAHHNADQGEDRDSLNQRKRHSSPLRTVLRRAYRQSAPAVVVDEGLMPHDAVHRTLNSVYDSEGFEMEDEECAGYDDLESATTAGNSRDTRIEELHWLLRRDDSSVVRT
jgi:hypothetical protein